MDEDVRLRRIHGIAAQKDRAGARRGSRLEMFGSHWYANGIYRACAPVRLFLTDRRLILYRQEPVEVLFQTPLTAIQDWMVTAETHFTGTRGIMIYPRARLRARPQRCMPKTLGACKMPSNSIGVTGPMVRRPARLSFPSSVTGAGGSALIQEKTVADGKLWCQDPWPWVFTAQPGGPVGSI